MAGFGCFLRRKFFLFQLDFFEVTITTLNIRCYLLVVLCLNTPDFAACSLLLHKHVANDVINRLSTFARLVLNALVPILCYCKKRQLCFSVKQINVFSFTLRKSAKIKNCFNVKNGGKLKSFFVTDLAFFPRIPIMCSFPHVPYSIFFCMAVSKCIIFHSSSFKGIYILKRNYVLMQYNFFVSKTNAFFVLIIVCFFILSVILIVSVLCFVLYFFFLFLILVLLTDLNLLLRSSTMFSLEL